MKKKSIIEGMFVPLIEVWLLLLQRFMDVRCGAYETPAATPGCPA